MRKMAWATAVIVLLQWMLPAGMMRTAGAEHYSISLSTADQSLRGTLAVHESYFHIPDYWAVSGASFRLDYKATPLAREEESSVTLLMNGTPFHSFRPVADGERATTVRVPIPAELLVPGANRLTMQGAVRTREIEEGCVPEDSRDSWIRVLKSSAAEIEYKERPLEGSIRDFYHRFAGMDAAAMDRRIVVVPDDAGSPELEAAAHVIAGFAKASEIKDRPIPLVPYSEAGWKTRPFVVFVALRSNLPQELSSRLGEEPAHGETLIRLVETESAHMLVATSDEPEQLARAGRLLANADLASQLDGKVARVTERTNVSTPAVAVNRMFKLTESGDKLVGAFHQTRSYFISLPANRSIADSSKIRLDFRYSRNLDFDRSLVTLLVDDKPIGSKKLSEERADGDSLTLPVPKNMNVSGNFAVTAAFDLELASGYCARNGQEMPWAFIGANSEMQLNTRDRTDLLLDNYPYPFLRDGVFHKVAVVLPKEKNRYVLGAVSNLFSLLGQYAEGNTGELGFYGEGDDPAAYKDRNVIAIGGYNDNSLIRNSNPAMYFRFGEDGRTFLSNEKKNIDPGYGARLGTIQLVESPLEEGKGLLAVAGSGSEYVYLASKLIASEGDRWKVWGDAVLADADGTVESYRFKAAEESGPSRTFGSIAGREDVLQFLTAAALVLVLVLLSLLLLVRKYRRKRGGGRET